MERNFQNLLNGDDDDDESDDVDYVPSEHDSVSDVEGGESTDHEDEDDGDGSRRGRKRKDHDEDGEEEEEEEEEKAAKRKKDDEYEKKRSDALWQSFKAAVNDVHSSKEAKEASPSENIPGSASASIAVSTSSSPCSFQKVLSNQSKSPIVCQKPDSSAQIKMVPTTSEEVGRTQGKPAATLRPVGAVRVAASSSSSRGRGNRLDSILAQIEQSKRGKSILEQSREHWEDFKQSEGISDELASHNRGAKGYLERQDFLARVDSRQGDNLRQMRLQLMNKRRKP